MPNPLLAAQQALDFGDPAAAIALLEPLVEGNPSSAHAMLHLARAKAAVEANEEADALLQRAEAFSRETADLFRGEILLRQDRLQEAEQALVRAVSGDEHNPLAKNLLALCLFRQGLHRNAFGHWQEAGWSHTRSYLVEITIAFEQFLLQAPSPPSPPPDNLQEVFRPQHQRGFSFIRRLVQLKPMLNKAERLLTHQKTLEAYRLTTRALEIAPQDEEARLLRAVALYEMECYEEAGRLLLELAREESFPLPRYFLAYSLLRLGELEVAEALMSQLAPQGPFDYYLNYHLGLARLLRGDLQGARNAFHVAYRDFFIDSREYCFEHLIVKTRAAVERLEQS